MCPSRDPSIFEEPHYRSQKSRPDESEDKARRILQRDRPREESDDEQVEHTVWDEPALSPELSGEIPPDRLDYATWLETRRRETTPGISWGVTWVVIFLAGPWALLGAIMGGLLLTDHLSSQIFIVIVIGPVMEEIMKTAVALYLVEKRPFLFTSSAQIIICVLSGALVFAVVENLLYLHVYVPDPASSLIYWRWTVCTALHVSCSLIASLGLVRIWRTVWKKRARAELSLAFPYLLIAVVTHGAYNTFAVILSLTKYHF